MDLTFYFLLLWNSETEHWAQFIFFVSQETYYITLLELPQKYPSLGCFSSLNLFSFIFWMLEVQDKDVSGFSFFGGLSPWVVDICLSLYPHAFPLSPVQLQCLSKCPNLLFLLGHYSDWIKTHSTGLIYL